MTTMLGGPHRALYARPNTEVNDLRDIMVMERGAHQFDAVEPWRDLSAIKSGLMHDEATIKFWLAEFTVDYVVANLLGGSFSFAAVWRSRDEVFHAVAWASVIVDVPLFEEALVAYRKSGMGENKMMRLDLIPKSEKKEL